MLMSCFFDDYVRLRCEGMQSRNSQASCPFKRIENVIITITVSWSAVIEQYVAVLSVEIRKLQRRNEFSVDPAKSRALLAASVPMRR